MRSTGRCWTSPTRNPRERITSELHRLGARPGRTASRRARPARPPPTGSSTPAAGEAAAASWPTCGTAATPTASPSPRSRPASPTSRPASAASTDKVRYHHRNMLDTGFESGAYQASGTTSRTMYVESGPAVRRARPAAAPRRPIRVITGCYNDTYGQASREVSLINAHYICDIHPRAAYFRAMARNRLVPVHVVGPHRRDHPLLGTAQAGRPSGHRHRGHLPDRYKNGSFQYLLIAADRV